MDEAGFAKRYGELVGCDFTGLAAKMNDSLVLPLRPLTMGRQRIPFRYVETGWPLGFPATNGAGPVELRRMPVGRFRNLPRSVRGERRYGVLRMGPASEFAFILEWDGAWKDARMWVARRGDGDFSGAVPLENVGSKSSGGFATLVIVHPAYPGAGTHPLILWVFVGPEGEQLNYYAMSHWRAAVEFPSGEKAFLVRYDFKGSGDYSLVPLALADASIGATKLRLHADGADYAYREPEGDIDWKARGFLGLGRTLRLSHAQVRLKALSPKGDWADVEILPR